MDGLEQAIADYSDAVRFERLCCDVLARSGYVGVDPQGKGRRDGGKDALAEHPRWGFAVCHFSLRKDWHRKLREDIATVRASALRFDHFVFVTSQDLTAGDKDTAKRSIGEAFGTTADILDRSRLRVAMSADLELRSEYFPGTTTTGTIEVLAGTLKSLVDLGSSCRAVTKSRPYRRLRGRPSKTPRRQQHSADPPMPCRPCRVCPTR